MMAFFVICGVNLLVAANSESILHSIRFIFWAAILYGMMAMCYAFPLATLINCRILRKVFDSLAESASEGV